MNSEKKRQRQIKVATIVLLFCLFTGIAVYQNTQSGQEQNPVVVSEELVSGTPRMETPLQIKEMSSIQHMTLQANQAYFAALPLIARVENEVEKVKTPVEKPVTEPAGNKPLKQKVEVKNLSMEPKKEKNEVEVSSANSDGFVYDPEIPMPEKHQKYLYDLCKERGLNYKKAHAVIRHESKYDSNVISATDDYGYFQVNIVNHKNLSNALKTPNEPLDPYVNLNWGTYMLSDLYDYWKDKGVSGSNLDEYVWSSYNKGLGGFKEHGKATNYIKKVREALTEISA